MQKNHQNIALVHFFFQNLDLGKASTNDKCPLATFVKIIMRLKKKGPNSFFFSSKFGPRQSNDNDIWQSLGLDPVNINVLAKFHQNKAYMS